MFICINFICNFQLITADGSPVVMPNQNASNGVIHVVDRVLFPIPLKNIPEQVTMERGRFSTLLTGTKLFKGQIILKCNFYIFMSMKIFS